MSDALTPVIMQFGLGGIGGFFIGYLIKKLLKFALFIGAFVFAIAFFVYESSLEINYAQLIANVEKYITPLSQMIGPLLSQIPVMGSLVLGVIIGFTKS